MDLKQTASIVKAAIGQMNTGVTADALDSATAVDVGKLVIDGEGNLVKATAEKFMNSAISLIAKIEVDKRLYSGDLKGLMISNDEWGNGTERTYFNLGDIIDDPKWNLYNAYHDAVNPKTNYAAEELGFYPTESYTKLFDEFKAILCPISKPTDQLKEACRSDEDMRQFLTGIQSVVVNTLENGITSYRHMLVQCGIMTAILKTGNVINLNQEFYDLTGTDVTGGGTDQFGGLKNQAFLIFAAKRIAEIRDYIKVYSTAWNDGKFPTFTPEEYQKLILLNAFEKAMRFNVHAQVFHPDNTTFGDYETTTAWQGVFGANSTKYQMGEMSQVGLTKASCTKLGITLAEGATADYQKGIIGVLFDKYAMSICPYKQKTTGNYIAVGDYFNEFHRVGLNLQLDDHFPIVVFQLGSVTVAAADDNT